MFSEAFDLVVGAEHDLAGHADVELTVELVRDARFLVHTGIDACEFEADRLENSGLEFENAHRVDCARDLEALIVAKFGVTLMPASSMHSTRLRHIRLREIDLRRTVAIYCVAGRARSREAGVFLNLVRSSDWQTAIASHQRELV